MLQKYEPVIAERGHRAEMAPASAGEYVLLRDVLNALADAARAWRNLGELHEGLIGAKKEAALGYAIADAIKEVRASLLKARPKEEG